MKIKFLLLLALFSIGVCAQDKTDEWLVFYLGGQSNMEGLGLNKELPKELMKGFDDIYIFHGNYLLDGEDGGGLGIWQELKPGHGAGFESDGENNKLSDRFGPELSLGKRLKELYPDKKIALIKYAKGGSKLDTIGGVEGGTWAPGFYGFVRPNQTDYFLTTLNNAFAVNDINNDGIEDRLIPSGIFWMQGESDALNKEAALHYYDNLNTMMCIIRGALRDMNLPIVNGKISDSGMGRIGKIWKHGELVMYAQEQFYEKVPNTRLVRTTQHYGYSDPAHYDSDGYIDLGIQFANDLYMLDKGLITRRSIPDLNFLK